MTERLNERVTLSDTIEFSYIDANGETVEFRHAVEKIEFETPDPWREGEGWKGSAWRVDGVESRNGFGTMARTGFKDTAVGDMVVLRVSKLSVSTTIELTPIVKATKTQLSVEIDGHEKPVRFLRATGRQYGARSWSRSAYISPFDSREYAIDLLNKRRADAERDLKRKRRELVKTLESKIKELSDEQLGAILGIVNGVAENGRAPVFDLSNLVGRARDYADACKRSADGNLDEPAWWATFTSHLAHLMNEQIKEASDD